jgi:glycosyltransferase involved in cell wall biosynthesis/GT2 family glycosyltransferase
VPRKVSVVVPTYNRVDQLRRTLEGLAGQTGLDALPEVVVVSDGSTDGTDEFLASADVPLPVIALRQDNAGPAAARNRGVRAATGELVLFVDDDVIPAADLVAAHLRHHAATDGDTVVIGPMVTPAGDPLSPWCQWEQDMLVKQYDAMDRGDWAATARQFYTANASLARHHVLDAGGFDERFRRAEDVELAYRLADRGLRFVFARDAVVVHHPDRSFHAWLDIAGAYGRNDVVFGRDLGQRWLLESIAREFHERHGLVRRLVRWCAPRPRVAAVVSLLLQGVARAAGLLRLGPVTRQALSALYNLAYYRGMASELGSASRMLAMFDGDVERALKPRVGFVLEQTLGHITHSANLEHLVGADHRVDAAFERIPYEVEGALAAVPGFRNWTIRAGIRARRAIRRLRRGGPLDGLFIHTQVPAILNRDAVGRYPTVVSLDATPIQYDELGAHYGHDTGNRFAEKLKWRANRACFARADAIVAWAEWTKAGLVARYDVPPEKVTVIPPGVDVARWTAYGDDAKGATETDGPLRVLFVGGDLERKGGRVLLDAVRSLREAGVAVELDVVTRDDVPAQDGVRAHHGLTPNSPQLIELYHRADVFCLPTLGDCLPMVLSEAGAVGLPLVSTDVGAIGEIVRDGETGLLVPVGDASALAAALRRLAADPPLRQKMGAAARQLVESDFDAKKNAARLVDLILDVTAAGRLVAP